MELGMVIDFSHGKQGYVLSSNFISSLFDLKFFEEVSFLIIGVFPQT